MDKRTYECQPCSRPDEHLLRVASEPSFDYLIVMILDEEAKRLRELLGGKIVKTVYRHRANEIVVEFSDGSRMFVDAPSDLEISVT